MSGEIKASSWVKSEERVVTQRRNFLENESAQSFTSAGTAAECEALK